MLDILLGAAAALVLVLVPPSTDRWRPSRPGRGPAPWDRKPEARVAGGAMRERRHLRMPRRDRAEETGQTAMTATIHHG